MAIPAGYTVESDTPTYRPVSEIVKQREGGAPGSKSRVNHNEGNLVYAKQDKAIKTPQGYAAFPDDATGHQALLKQIQLDASRGLSIQEFAKKYAPDKNPDGSPTGNDPVAYAKAIAQGRDVNSKLSDALRPEDSPASGVSKKTGGLPAGYKVEEPPAATGPSGMDWLKSKAEEGWQRIAPTIEAAKGNLWSSTKNLPKVLNQNTPGMPSTGDALPPVQPDPNGPHGHTLPQIPNYVQGVKDTGADLYNLITNPGEAFAKDPLGIAASVAGGVRGAAELAHTGYNIARGVPMEPPPAPEPPSPPSLPPGDANLKRATSKIVQATQPGKLTPKVQQAAETYIPNIKAQEAKTPGRPLDARTQEQYHQQVEDDLKRQFESYRGPAEARGAVMDGDKIADAHMGAIDSTDKLDHPADYQNAKDMTDRWRGPMSLADGYERMQKSYTDVKNWFNASPTDKTSMLIAGAKPARSLATYNAAREEFLKAIDPDNAGENAANIQRQRGDAITMRQPFRDLRIKMDQDIPTSTTQRLLTGAAGAGAAGVGAWDLLQGRLEGAVPALAGGYGLAKAIKPPTDLNAMVEDAFKNYKFTKAPTDLTNPNAGQVPPSRQLAPGPIRMGSQQVSAEPPKMNVTTGPPPTRDLTVNPNTGYPTNSQRLLEAGPIRMGSSQTSAEPPKMNVETGPSMEGEYSLLGLEKQNPQPPPEFTKQRSLLEVQPPPAPERKFPSSALFGRPADEDYFFPDWEYPKPGDTGSLGDVANPGGAIPNR